MIKVLENPKTIKFLSMKEYILSENFEWYWNEKSTVDGDGENVSFYSHPFLTRPEAFGFGGKYPKISCNNTESASTIIQEILEHNNIPINTFLRINANCVHPYSEVLKSVPHYDHEFPHKNILIYLSSSGGSTFVDDEEYSPQEDDVIVFEGLHYHETPLNKRRVVLVATFI